MTRKVDVLCGLQFGSEGKGAIAGYLAYENGYDTVISTNMPNAGHTFIDPQNDKHVFKVLPCGAVAPLIKNIMIGPDAVFQMSQLELELSHVPKWRGKLFIHEGAVILDGNHKHRESSLVDQIGSTAQGSAATMVDKIMRKPVRVGDHRHRFSEYVLTDEDWYDYLDKECNYILLEGAQGYSLGLNAGFYPYCTSRDCTPTRIVAGAGIPYTWVRDVIGAARIYPIRVGGNSGPGYPDQKELSWQELALLPEYTTVTQRERRVFEFSNTQMKRAIQACQPNYVFLNFMNYNPDMGIGVMDRINTFLSSYGPNYSHVRWTGWGPHYKDIRDEAI